MSGGRYPERATKEPAKYGTYSAHIAVGDEVHCAALTGESGCTQSAKFLYAGVVATFNADGTYDVTTQAEGGLETVRNVDVRRLLRPDGTRVKPGTAPASLPAKRLRRNDVHAWSHEGIWSAAVDPVDAEAGAVPEMQDRLKFHVSTSYKLRGRWVDDPNHETISLRQIMESEPEIREMHLRALVDFHASLFHADASAREFTEWLGDVDPHGSTVSEEVAASRAEVYAKHAQFFAQPE